MKITLQGLLFDLDGTLIDSARDLTMSANVVRRHFQLDKLSQQQVISYLGDGLAPLIARLLPNHSCQELATAATLFSDHYRRHDTDYTRPYPGVIDTLHWFAGKSKAVITNKPYAAARRILQTLELSDYFSIVLGGDSTPEKKPHPLPLQQVLTHLHLEAGTTVMVGDSDIDIKAGKSAGVLTCAVSYGMRSRQLLAQSDPDFLIDDFRQLQELFV